MIPGLDFSPPLFALRVAGSCPVPINPLPIPGPLVDLDVALQTSRCLRRLSARADRQSDCVTRPDGPPNIPSVFLRREVVDPPKLGDTVLFGDDNIPGHVPAVVSQKRIDWARTLNLALSRTGSTLASFKVLT